MISVRSRGKVVVVVVVVVNCREDSSMQHHGARVHVRVYGVFIHVSETNDGGSNAMKNAVICDGSVRMYVRAVETGNGSVNVSDCEYDDEKESESESESGCAMCDGENASENENESFYR